MHLGSPAINEELLCAQLDLLRQPESEWQSFWKTLGEAGIEISPIGDIRQIVNGVPQIVDDLGAIAGFFVDYIQDRQKVRGRHIGSLLPMPDRDEQLRREAERRRQR